MKVYKADWKGREFYYLPQDLEWFKDYGGGESFSMPKPGAIPRNANGKPIQVEDLWDY